MLCLSCKYEKNEDIHFDVKKAFFHYRSQLYYLSKFFGRSNIFETCVFLQTYANIIYRDIEFGSVLEYRKLQINRYY